MPVNSTLHCRGQCRLSREAKYAIASWLRSIQPWRSSFWSLSARAREQTRSTDYRNVTRSGRHRGYVPFYVTEHDEQIAVRQTLFDAVHHYDGAVPVDLEHPVVRHFVSYFNQIWNATKIRTRTVFSFQRNIRVSTRNRRRSLFVELRTTKRVDSYNYVRIVFQKKKRRRNVFSDERFVSKRGVLQRRIPPPQKKNWTNPKLAYLRICSRHCDANVSWRRLRRATDSIALTPIPGNWSTGKRHRLCTHFSSRWSGDISFDHQSTLTTSSRRHRPQYIYILSPKRTFSGHF